MKKISYGGKVHSFPDSFTDDDIQKALQTFDAGSTVPQSASEAATTGATGRFIRAFGEQVNPIPLINSLLQDPKGTAGAILNPIFENPTQALGEMVGAPFVRAAEQVSEGDIAGAAGTAVGVGLPLAVGAGKPSFKVGVKSRLNPVQASAVQFAEQEGIPLSAGVKTGSNVIQGLEAGMKHLPGPAGVAEKSAAATDEAMQRVASSMGQRIEPTGAATAVEAGEAVQRNLGRRINNYDTAADTAYSKLREIAEEKAKAVPRRESIEISREPQIGRTPEETRRLFFRGSPTEKTQVPIPAGKLAGAVDIRAFKQQVATIVDEIEGTMINNLGEAEQATMRAALKQASPGYATLRQIVDSPDFMSVADADRNLSALKQLARNNQEHASVRAAMRNKSQGLMSWAIPKLSHEIDNAVSALGTEAQKALLAGRTATKRKYELNDILRQFSTEPVRAFEKLTAGRDRSISLLNEIKANAPEALPDVARATIEGIVERSMDRNGVFRGQKALADWNRLGKDTKRLLYGGNLKQIEDMFQLGNMIRLDANPSGSARVGAGLAVLNAAVGSPLRTSAKLAGARKLAQAIYSGDTEFVINAPKVFGKVSLGTQVLGQPLREGQQ